MLLIHHSKYDLFKMASRMVPVKIQPCGSVLLPVGMPDGFVTDQTPCLQRFVDEFMNPACMSYISFIVQAGMSESGIRSSDMSDIMASLYSYHQTSNHPSSICARLVKC